MPARLHRTKIRGKAQLTLPAPVRDALRISEGDEVEFEVRPDGVVEVHGLKTVRSDQAWFWTDSWQTGEREAGADIEAGRVTVHDDVDGMFADLDS